MLPAPTPQIAIVNESTLVNAQWCWNLAWVLNYQVEWQAGPLLKCAAKFVAIEPGKAAPSGAWILHLIDEITDAPDALGYHDEDGNRVPFGRIGIKTSLDNNSQPAEVVSHEALEILGDPHINLTAFDPANDRLYPVELCDPVQGGAYDLGAPYGRTTGWICSDFATVDWFDPNTPSSVATSYRHTTKGPFSLGTAGYVSYSTTLPPSWEQEFGEKADHSIADNDDRVSRRLAAA